MKKLLCILLCMLIAAVALAGCGGGGTTSSDETTEAAGPKTITVGMPMSPMVLDYDTNAYTLWLEEVSGYNIEFKYYANSPSDYTNQLSTETAADQELPDILWRFRLNDDTINNYGEDGYFIDLSEYFNDREKSANWWYMAEKYMSEDEISRVWTLIHSDYRENLGEGAQMEGPIYVFPTAETTLIDTMVFMPLINQEWLDALKLEHPKNLQELKQVLIAFRDQDPNGNGLPDEVPMIGSQSALGCYFIEWILNFYIYYDSTNFFNLDENGNLYIPQTQDAYREALKYLRELVEENLLHINTLSYTYVNLRGLLQNTDTVGVTVGHPSLIFNNESTAIQRWEALDLYGYAYDSSNQLFRDVFITDSCDDPDAAWDLLMHMCTEESAYRLRYGELGVDWDYADPGTTSCMGLPATIKVYNDIWNTTCNQSWLMLAAGVYPYSENEQNQVTGEETDFMKKKYELYNDLRTNFDEAKKTVDPALVLPLLRFNDEEDEIAKTRSDVKSTVTTWRSYFMDGTKDIHNNDHWNEYLQELEKAGSKEYLDAATICYKRMYKSGT